MKKNLIVSMIISTLLATSVTGCGGGETSNSKTQPDGENGGAKTVKIAYATNAYPLAYKDENGNVTGYEVEVMKAVDEALDQYSFTFEEAAQDAVYTGLSTGKYDIALTNAFYTDERAANYNIPKNQLGASPVGLIVKKENQDIKTLEDAAAKKLKGSPVLAGDGLTYQLDQYNKEHADKKVSFEYTDSTTAFMDSIGWVAEGRYDFTLWPYTYWKGQIEAEDGSLHQYYDQLVYQPYLSVPTYAVIAKGEDDLTKAVDDELGKLGESGKLVELSQKFYGYNVFEIDK